MICAHRLCPECGWQIPADAPESGCPGYLLETVLGSVDHEVVVPVGIRNPVTYGQLKLMPFLGSIARRPALRTNRRLPRATSLAERTALAPSAEIHVASGSASREPPRSRVPPRRSTATVQRREGNFPRNLAPDLTHYLCEHIKWDRNL